ncbi:MAG: CZB domain-containing protein [Planctomycetota bacterium]
MNHRTQSTAVQERGEELVVFTFTLGETAYAVPLHEILAVNSMPDQWMRMPTGSCDTVKVIEYRGRPTEMIDFAAYLGVRSSSEAKLEIAELLEQRERDHVLWIEALEDSIKNGTPFTKATNPHECAFGKWYDNYETKEEGFAELMAKFDAPHRRIHSLAETLLGIAETDQKRALAQLEVERNTTLAEMRRLFASARQHLRRLARRVVLFLTVDGSTPALGLALDEINDVRRFYRSQLQDMDQVGATLEDRVGELFTGILVAENEESCVLLNTRMLLS